MTRLTDHDTVFEILINTFLQICTPNDTFIDDI